MKKRLLVAVACLAPPLALVAWGAFRVYQAVAPGTATPMPTTVVKRGEVSFTINAKGELQGGNTEMLSAPMIGGSAMAITSLRESGELIKEGEVVVEFDTTEQEFKLREAEPDLAEAEQHLALAQADSQAKEEEARSGLRQARADVRVAELETRRNELLSAMVAKQNDLAVAAAQDKLRQLEKDLADRLATAKAGIAIQQAARAKARVAANTARRNIASMTLRSKSGGYVARQQNMSGNFRWGSYQPAWQVGDMVRAGMGVAQIPDLLNWEVSARIGELDRGHLAPGQNARISVIALPGRQFNGRLKSIGGTTGPPWDRHFDCRVALDDPLPELRPGMSVRLVITTETMKNALWLPSQALFESDGRKFVYARSVAGFTPVDVKLLRRSESQIVIEGLTERQVVALASPDQMRRQEPSRPGGALQAIPK